MEQHETCKKKAFPSPESSVWSARKHFEEYIYSTFAQAMHSWEKALCNTIYALSFFIYDRDDDPRQPMVHLSSNTTDYWAMQIAKASDADEARWNVAFWPQECKAIIATPDGEHMVNPDPTGIALRAAWLASEDMVYHDEAGEHLPVRGIEQTFQLMEKWQDVTQAFVDVCIRVASRLHESGLITAVFGRTVPILLHELEYYQLIADQTRAANPSGVTQEFEDWVTGLYS